jgi:hypothetical protein
MENLRLACGSQDKSGMAKRPHVDMQKRGGVLLPIPAPFHILLSVIPCNCNDDRLTFVLNWVHCVSGCRSIGSLDTLLRENFERPNAGICPSLVWSLLSLSKNCLPRTSEHQCISSPLYFF